MYMYSAILTLLAGPATLAGAPEPSAAPHVWELDFEFHDLQRITLTLPGDTKPTTFWYLLYTVTNHTGRDVDFYPSFTLVTQTMQVVEAGLGVSPSVYDAIDARHRKLYPFFVEPSRLLGVLRQGTDNSRTSAAVFPDFDPQANELTVYVAGLSGETARVMNPTFDPDQPASEENKEFFVLRKTLAIQYDLPGDVRSRESATPARKHRDWVMR